MIDLALQQSKFREKRRDQLARQKERYDAVQSFQLVSDDIAAKARASGIADLPPTDPLKVKQATLAAAMPGLQEAAKNADQAVRSLFDELNAEPDFQKLVGQLGGDTPFLLFPVRLETRFCRTRYFVRPASKDWLLDFSNTSAPDVMRGWGLQISPEGTALQIRAPFPFGTSEAQFNSLIDTAVKSGALRPANGQWLQRKADTVELRVRILPDDLNIDSFEENLTPAEFERGRHFWQRIWKGNKPEDAWDELRSFFSTPRSAWVLRQTRPLNFVDSGPLPAQPQFPEPRLRANSYTRAPMAAALPDFFAAILYKTGQPERLVKGLSVSPELATGFDPNEPDPTSFQPGADGDLKFPEALRWIFNFDEAEKKGLAIRIPLTEDEFTAGFDKLVVLGVKLSAGKEEGKESLERLFQNQLYQEKGMYLLPQGTPTNNFETAKSGYNWPDQEAARYFKATWKGGHTWTDAQRTDPFAQTDGLRLTQALGLVEDLSRKLPGADGEDTREALLMNRLLFPGTLGYWLRQFFSPPLLEADLNVVQQFFEKFVIGRGLLPTVRIGQQPYGILPATAFKFWKSKDPQDFPQRLLDQILKKLDVSWDALKGQVLFAGDGRVTANQLSEDLMRLVGNEPASSRFAQQVLFGEGHLNFMLRMNFFNALGNPAASPLNAPPVVNQFQGQVEPELRARFWDLSHFSAFRFMHIYPKKRQLEGPLIDELPSSENRLLLTIPGSTWTYLDWLFQSSIEDFWKEQFQNLPLTPGSLVPPPPNALLYHFARFALRRGALEGAVRLLEPDEKLRILKSRDFEVLSVSPDAGTEFTPATLNDLNLLQRMVKPLVQALAIQNKFTLVPDRFSFFGQMTGSPSQPVKDILQQGTAPAAAAFARQRQTLPILRNVPTARLERLLSEHLDLCGHRLDAWFSALVYERLNRQRSAPATGQGIYLGAFGFLENVRPGNPAIFAQEIAPTFSSQFDNRTVCLPLVSTKHLQMSNQVLDKLLPNSFVYLGDRPANTCRFDFATRKVVVQIQDAPGNQGFIHGPSHDHAAAAAILRAGWQSRQAEGNDANTLAVRLDSPRVRSGLALLEGIGQGDSLAALLGYQLERKLHDTHLDSLIFKLRRLFPFKTDQAASAFAATTDGMAIIKAWRSSPTGWGGVALTAAERQNLDSLLTDLNSQFDSFGDLMLAESVFQTVKGSPARSAASLRTLNASGQLHQPEVVRTPQTGSLVTFRTGVVFPTSNFLSRWGKTLTPKAVASPRLNNWLASQLPDPAKTIVTASADGGAAQKLTLVELDLQPIDLLVMFPEPNAGTGENSHLAWQAQAVFRKKLTLPASAVVKIDFRSRAVAAATDLTIFEVGPLVDQLTKLMTASRLITATDFIREGGQGAAPVFNTAAIQTSFVTIVKTDRQPEKLANRLLLAKGDLENKLTAATPPDVLQTAWSALLDPLAECVRWHLGNLALEMPVLFDASQLQILLQKATHAANVLQRTQTDADPLLTQLVAAPAADKMALCERLGERLFGRNFRLSPLIQLTNLPVVAQARTTDLSKNLDVLSVENWQLHSALVHPVFRLYRQCALLREALAAPVSELTVIQLNSPTAAPGYWIGAEMRGAPAGSDISQTFAGTLSLALELPANWNPALALAGLVFDEWTEVLPARETTTGVAFHFNQPDTEPPQVMLLAVCPAEGENWRWEYLSETILDTFERAKKRLVNFENLRTNPALAHLLPAVVAPLERENLAPNLDFGRNVLNVPIEAKGAAPLVSI